MHAVVGDFVDAAGGRFDLVAIEMVERDSAFADGVGFLDRFRNVSLSQRGGFKQGAAGRKMSRNDAREGATSAVQAFYSALVSRERHHVISCRQNVYSILRVA